MMNGKVKSTLYIATVQTAYAAVNRGIGECETGDLAVDQAVFQSLDLAVHRDLVRAVCWDPLHPGLSAYFGSVAR